MDTVSNLKNKSNTRSFRVKLEKDSNLYGRYNGESPYQAANKALSEIIRKKIKSADVVDNINFYLVESTKGSCKKEHEYNGNRIKLEKPVEYTVGNGQVIIKEYKNILRKVKKNEN